MKKPELDKCLELINDFIKLYNLEIYTTEFDMSKLYTGSFGGNYKNSVDRMIKAWDYNENCLFTFNWQNINVNDEILYICNFITCLGDKMEIKGIDFETLEFCVNKIKCKE